MRDSTLPVHIADGDLADRSSMPGGQRRNKAVQLAVEWHLFENVAAIRLKSGAEIVNIHTAEFGHYPIGATRRNSPEPQIVNALLAPSANNVVAFRDFLQKYRNIGGVVLQIAIHGDNVLAACVIESGSKRRSLPEITPQANNSDAAVHARNLAKQVKCLVRRTVINEDDFETFRI